MAKGKENGMWKGDSASYYAKHIWMKTNFGKPQMCENCGTTERRMYHWANISGRYIRDRSDWLRLCVPCHKSHDIKALGGHIKSRTLKVQPSKLCSECGVEFFKSPAYSHLQWSTKSYCSKSCSAKVTGRGLLGTKQSTETRALKSEKLRERWATNTEWREHVTSKMTGNLFAYKEVTKQPRRKALQERIDMKKFPLARDQSGSNPTKKVVKKSKGTIKSADKYRHNAVNSKRQNPGFSGAVK